MHSKTIMLLIGTIKGGGAERVCVTLANHLAIKNKVIVATGGERTDKDYRLGQNVERVCLDFNYGGARFLSNFFEYVKRVIAVRKLAQAYDADFIIGFCTSDAIRAVISVIGLKTKAIAAEH